MERYKRKIGCKIFPVLPDISFINEKMVMPVALKAIGMQSNKYKYYKNIDYICKIKTKMDINNRIEGEGTNS